MGTLGTPVGGPIDAEDILGLPLTGVMDSAGDPFVFTDGAIRVNSILFPRTMTFLGAAVQALVRPASSTLTVDISILSVIDRVIDDDDSNDVSLFPTGPKPTIAAGKNFGEFCLAPEHLVVPAGTVLTAGVITSGRTPLVDTGLAYAIIEMDTDPDASFHINFSAFASGPGSDATPIDLNFSLTHDADGVTAITNALTTAGYVLPNPIQLGAPPTPPGCSPPYIGDPGTVFYWQVDPADLSGESAGEAHGSWGGYHPIVPPGQPADGVTVLLYLK